MSELRIDNPDAAPPGTPLRFALREGRQLIGRGEDVDWRLPDPTRLVSSVHCAIELRGNEARVSDLSRNGTALDGVSLNGGVATLGPGAVLTVGPYRLRREGGTGTGIDDVAGGYASGRGAEQGDALARAVRAALRGIDEVMHASASWRDALDAPPATRRADAGRELDRLMDGDPTPIDALEARHEALALHERAWLPAVQVALFRFLNDLSPEAVEAETGGLNADARRWRRYRAHWEGRATATENGMLDPFMEHLRESYREQLEELRAGRGGTDDTRTRD